MKLQSHLIIDINPLTVCPFFFFFPFIATWNKKEYLQWSFFYKTLYDQTLQEGGVSIQN